MINKEEKSEVSQVDNQVTEPEKKVVRKRSTKSSKKITSENEKQEQPEVDTPSNVDVSPKESVPSAKREPIKGVRDMRKSKQPEVSKDQDVPSESSSGESVDSGENEITSPKRSRNRNRSRNSKKPELQQQRQNTVEVDVKLVAKRAWKIYIGEVNEDGVALIDDRAAREIAKRSFKIAEIFTEEEERKKSHQKQQKQRSVSNDEGGEKDFKKQPQNRSNKQTEKIDSIKSESQEKAAVAPSESTEVNSKKEDVVLNVDSPAEELKD